MAKTITSVKSAGKGWTEVTYSDGTSERIEGTRANRNNNPGNIEYGKFAKSMGAVGTDGRFAVFPDPATGFKAMEGLLFSSPSYRDLTIADAISRYAPAFENNTSKYARIAAAAAGVPVDTPLSSLDENQRASMVSAMAAHEGYNRSLAQAYANPTGNWDSVFDMVLGADNAIPSPRPDSMLAGLSNVGAGQTRVPGAEEIAQPSLWSLGPAQNTDMPLNTQYAHPQGYSLSQPRIDAWIEAVQDLNRSAPKSNPMWDLGPPVNTGLSLADQMASRAVLPSATDPNSVLNTAFEYSWQKDPVKVAEMQERVNRAWAGERMKSNEFVDNIAAWDERNNPQFQPSNSNINPHSNFNAAGVWSNPNPAPVNLGTGGYASLSAPMAAGPLSPAPAFDAVFEAPDPIDIPGSAMSVADQYASYGAGRAPPIDPIDIPGSAYTNPQQQAQQAAQQASPGLSSLPDPAMGNQEGLNRQIDLVQQPQYTQPPAPMGPPIAPEQDNMMDPRSGLGRLGLLGAIIGGTISQFDRMAQTHTGKSLFDGLFSGGGNGFGFGEPQAVSGGTRSVSADGNWSTFSPTGSGRTNLSADSGPVPGLSTYDANGDGWFGGIFDGLFG